MFVIVVENKVLRSHLHPIRRPIRRKGEKGGKEVSLSFSKKCPLCPRPDNGRLHDAERQYQREEEKTVAGRFGKILDKLYRNL